MSAISCFLWLQSNLTRFLLGYNCTYWIKNSFRSTLNPAKEWMHLEFTRLWKRPSNPRTTMLRQLCALWTDNILRMSPDHPDETRRVVCELTGHAWPYTALFIPPLAHIQANTHLHQQRHWRSEICFSSRS